MIKFLKFVPVQLTLLLTIGILIGHYFSINSYSLIIMSIGLFVILSVFYIISFKKLKPSVFYTFFSFLLIITIGVSSIILGNQLNKSNHYSNTLNFKAKTNKTAVLYIREVLKSTGNYNRYITEITTYDGFKTKGKIVLNLKKSKSVINLNVDDFVLIDAPFLEINKPLNPYAFDYKKYLENKQIHHQVFINNNEYLLISNKVNSIKGMAGKLREAINNSLVNYGFKDNELAVINALLLGQRQSISKDLIESYSNAGAIHILAVSGLHIGIILMILTFLFKPLHRIKNGKLISSVLIIMLLWAFAIVAGLSASVVRAVSMFTALSIGMHLNRPTNTYNTLIISMFFLLLFNPYYLFEVGFQMSYLAVFSIVWIQPKLYNLIIPKNWFLRKIWQLLTVSFAAQLGVLPLSIFYFHQFPGLFFISNLVIIPFLGVLLIYGIFVIILGLFNLLPQTLADIFIEILKYLNNFVEWIGSKQVFIIDNISISLVLMIAIYAFMVVFFKYTEKMSFYRVISTLLLFISIQCVLIVERYKLETTNEFIVFNESRRNILTSRFGKKLEVYSNLDSVKFNYNLKPYLLKIGLTEDFKNRNPKNYYEFKNEKILVVDSLGIYNFSSVKPSVIILQNSPKINLERLLKLHKPKVIVTDASNYSSYIKNWESTCNKKKTPFYNTMQKGAFILKE
ncbi:ComEC/Rec2 family competence protein [Lutibacter citreus]|uniref:ComEC/Rec2 family competence protein n=1 Tax=Lutibacter citreus TaxID=2138210 RepID=UPI000DBE38A3|nr:ComEC/Rec2 family competence protein [Lutibacter citreus]